MKRKMKLSTARWILRGFLGLIVLAVAIGIFSEEQGAMARWIWNAVGIGVLYTVFKLIFWRCPHCGRLLGKMRLDTEYCYYCSEKLEE